MQKAGKTGTIGKGRKIGKRIAAWLLAAALLAGMGSMAGCGQGGNDWDGDGSKRAGGENAEEGNGNIGEGNQGDKAESSSDVMGRYLETMDDSLKDVLNVGSTIQRMEDGKLVIVSTYSGKWVSGDNGASWEWEEMAWFEELSAANWIMNVAVAKDGYMAVIYEPQGEDGSEGSADKGAESGSTDTEEETGREEGSAGAGAESGSTDTEEETGREEIGRASCRERV